MYRVAALFLIFATTRLEAQGPRQRIQAEIIERFMENYRAQAGLTPEQFTRFRTVALRSFTQRREHQQQERQLWLALEGQMRPGIAANPDSVSKLLDAMVAMRVAQVDQLKADDREYAAFLSPVQRAQLYLAVERLQRNIEDIMRRRMQGLQRGEGGAPEP